MTRLPTGRSAVASPEPVAPLERVIVWPARDGSNVMVFAPPALLAAFTASRRVTVDPRAAMVIFGLKPAGSAVLLTTMVAARAPGGQAVNDIKNRSRSKAVGRPGRACRRA